MEPIALQRMLAVGAQLEHIRAELRAQDQELRSFVDRLDELDKIIARISSVWA